MRDDSLGDGVSEAGHGPATRWSERDKSFMKVLVADDDPTTRTLLRRLLIRDYDCAVTEVENGLEALTQLDRQHFSVLLLDVQMPVMGGLEALEAIRGSSHSSLPVVMLTAERGETVVKKAVGLGITDYLIKPLKPNWVGERLAQVMHSLVSDAGAPPDGDAGGVTPDQQLSVVVAEGDPDYRHFLMDFFNPRCAALQASSGSEALTLCLRAGPRLVFIGGELGIIDAETLTSKIRAASTLSQTRIIATVPRSRIAEIQARGLYDGVIARSFLPEVFRDQFERLTASTGPPVEALEKLHPRFRTSLLTATERVFGMAVSTQIEIVPQPEGPAGDVLAATISLNAPERELSVEITLRVRVDTADTLTRRMGGYKEDETVSDEDLTATLGELINMIVGRVQNTLAERGVAAEIGLPTTERRQAVAATAGDGTMLAFETDDGSRIDVIAVAHALVRSD